MGVDAASTRYRYDALLCIYSCERATDANGECIHPSHRGPAITGKIANNGLRPFHGHHRNVGYAAKRAKICIHKKGGGAVN